MAELAEVKAPPSQKGKPKPKSEVAYPYYDLDKSVEVARIIHAEAGGTCDRAQLAGLLKYSGTRNGGFLSRVSAAKMFGLLEENQDKLTLTERAKTILSPVMPCDAERAKVEAFLSVDFFLRIYEQFKGQVLPAEVGLKNLLQTQYKIVPDRVIPALRVLMDSAESAGFFRVSGNRSRMTEPIIASNGGQPSKEPPPPPPPASDENRGMQQKTRGGSGGDGSNIHPALLGLIQNLPQPGSILGPKRRKALTDAFASTINFLYPEEEEEL